MRFIHTADLHLDACYASSLLSPAMGSRLRQDMRDVLQAIIQRARDWPADALLIAGDLFCLDYVRHDTVSFLIDAFDSIGPIPVVIAPGNHDPFVSHSPYAAEQWPSNVKVFGQPCWTAFTFEDLNLVVHGFAFDGPAISDNPFGSLTFDRDDRVHVGVAHGTERANQPPDGKTVAPFDAPGAAVDGLAYLALGHFHKATPIEGDFATRMNYCGAPAGQAFDEPGPHCFLEVEIDKGEVAVKEAPSSNYTFAVYEIDCSARSTADEVRDAIRAVAEGAQSPQVARVILRGACPPALAREIARIREEAAASFAYLALVDETYTPEDCERLARTNNALGAFVRGVNGEMADAPDDARRNLARRARTLGLAARRGCTLPIRGLETGASVVATKRDLTA